MKLGPSKAASLGSCALHSSLIAYRHLNLDLGGRDIDWSETRPPEVVEPAEASKPGRGHVGRGAPPTGGAACRDMM